MKSFLQLAPKSYNQYHNTIKDLNQNYVHAKYAIRGLIPTLAQEIQAAIQRGEKHPFDSITELNIGNPQIFGQKPITFNRQVTACLIDPSITKFQSKDVQRRANFYQEAIKVSCGAYSSSPGYPVIREAVSNFIQKRDNLNYKPSINDILLTDGASQGITLVFDLLVQQGDGVMIPIPQYPLYSALIVQCGGYEIPYYLDEDSQWSVSEEHLQRQYDDSVKQGIRPKILVYINPGNPTGQVFDRKTVETFIKFASDKRMTILADEVYQGNIYDENKQFLSVRRVSEDLRLNSEIYSFHSISKGIYGECGFRGGYLDITSNIESKVRQEITKTKSILICPNSVGQVMLGLMVTPPTKEEGCSQETIDQYREETSSLLNSLKKRAQMVYKLLNETQGISCQPIQGAMYAFPTINMSDKFINHARQQGLEPDDYYCIELLKATGLVVIPGTGFLQKPNTYHFRMTILIQPEDKLFQKMHIFKEWHEKFMSAFY